MTRMIYCFACGQQVSVSAVACPGCGHPLQEDRGQPQIHVNVSQNVDNSGHVTNDAISPGVAAILSFLIPGLGQMAKGQVLNGLVWLIFVVLGYALMVVPGFILHICCIVGAAQPSRR